MATYSDSFRRGFSEKQENISTLCENALYHNTASQCGALHVGMEINVLFFCWHMVDMTCMFFFVGVEVFL